MMNEPVKILSATPTLDTNAYAAGDCMGTKLTFDLTSWRDDRGGWVQWAVLTDLAKQNAVADLVLFGSDPSATTFTDNAAMDIADADLVKIIGVIKFDQYTSFNDNSIAQPTIFYGPAFSLDLKGSVLALYGILVSRGAPTYAAADLTVRLGLRGG